MPGNDRFTPSVGLIGTRCIFLLFLVFIGLVQSTNLYALLGVDKGATQSEIKKAYRKKARETHPDKNLDKDPEVAAEKFREVTDAYEILSDENKRRAYDRTGVKPDESTNRHHGNRQRSGGYWNFGFNFNFGFGNGQRSQRRKRPDVDRRLFDPYLKRQIYDALSRVIHVHDINHFRNLALGDDGLTDKRVLLALWSSSVDGCEDKMKYRLLFPYPFAGYNLREGEGGAVWWDDIILPLSVDLANRSKNKGLDDLGNHFNVYSLNENNCPTVAFIEQGAPMSSNMGEDVIEGPNTHDEYADYIWQKLRAHIEFVNQTPWTLTVWWLYDFTGHKQNPVKPGESMAMNTYLNHEFIFRPDHVPGNSLNNESSLLFYRTQMHDDGNQVLIKPRCFDLDSNCNRWKQEGFCDSNIETRYTRANPGFRRHALAVCLVSCGNTQGCHDMLRSAGVAEESIGSHEHVEL